MTDAIDLFLNAAGWMVAGLVTVFGVLVAQRLKERSVERQEDMVRIFEPVHKELDTLMKGARDRRSKGLLLWAPSPEFLDLVSRGVLWQQRHDGLRRDVDRLVTLGEQQEKEHVAFLKDRRESIAEAFKVFRLPDMDKEAVARDEELHESLATKDRERWLRRLQVLGPAYFAVMGGKPEDPAYYEKTMQLIEDTRGPYDQATEALIVHAEGARTSLDGVISRGGRYRSVAPTAKKA